MQFSVNGCLLCKQSPCVFGLDESLILDYRQKTDSNKHVRQALSAYLKILCLIALTQRIRRMSRDHFRFPVLFVVFGCYNCLKFYI